MQPIEAMAAVQSFSCRIDNVKSITDVLTCLSGDLSKDQPCYIEVTSEGSLLGSLFDSYQCFSKL